MNKNVLGIIAILAVLTAGLLFLKNFYAEMPADKHLAVEHIDNPEYDQNTAGSHTPDHTSSSADTGTYTHSIEGLPDAQPTRTIILGDGDSYDIVASYVKKQVGNRTLRMLAYNGSVPGPFIRAPQDAEISINFRNDTDINQTIHSHGIRVDNLSDGVPDLTQDSVRPGESYTYTIKFQDAGVYWYHPHTREDYGQELGLYGNYLITPSEPDYWNTVNREIPLIIDDILIENDRISDFYKDFTNFALLGRFGNEFLVNGVQDYSLQVAPGEVIRFFVTNVSNTRTYRLSIPGVRLKLVGADIGRYEREFFSDDFLISPAERVVVEAWFENAGTYTLTHTTPARSIELAHLVAEEATRIETVYADMFVSLQENVDVIDEFAGFRDYLNTEPDKRLLLTINLQGQIIDHSQHAHMDEEPMPEGHAEHIQHMQTEHIDQPEPDAHADDRQKSTPEEHQEHMMHMQAEHTGPPLNESTNLTDIQWEDPDQADRQNTTPEISWQLVDEDSGRVSTKINDWVFRTGDLIKIRLTNDKNADHVMQHPIHFHGQRFVVLSENGEPNDNMAWKDTVMVLPGQTMDLLVSMDNSGEWMAHCHIAEHLHAGMMLTFRVEDKSGLAIGDQYRSTRNGHSNQHN